MDDLHNVQRLINRAVEYREDYDQYGLIEHWTEAGAFGDCEDYAIRKLRVLLLAGWDIKKLRLCFCWVDFKAPKQGHAVLIAEHNGKLYVLDNNADHVYSVAQRPNYIWGSCQVEGGSRAWAKCSEVFPRYDLE
jgi:predicted transglutaminase-like cysteine proteinase